MTQKHKLSRHLIALQAETKKYNRRRGLYTRIARDLGVTPAHVRNVAMGLRNSVRVEDALRRELSKAAA